MFINQPYDLQLGSNLIEKMTSKEYNNLSFIVAYAKLSGVHRLEPSILQFKANGGTIKCVVGIDQKNTSYEALVKLNSLVDELYIFHSEIYTQTFHPKCYWLSAVNKLWFAVGSNNLTSGGLFSNYEMSYCDQLDGNDATVQLSHLNDIMNRYSNPSSNCCHRADFTFIEDLFQNGYIEKELEQRKKLLKERNTTPLSQTKSLFGREIFKAPLLPGTQLTKKKNGTTLKPAHVSTLPTPSIEAKEYLIRQIPKAGGRSKQVHFTVDLLNTFFGLKQGDHIILQEIKHDGSVSQIENHQVVFSDRNRNVKIEMSGASILDTSYPTDPTKRPVLVVKHISNNFFTYTLLLDGFAGYSKINSRLSERPPSRSLPYELIDEETMLNLWPTCPIV